MLGVRRQSPSWVEALCRLLYTCRYVMQAGQSKVRILPFPFRTSAGSGWYNLASPSSLTRLSRAQRVAVIRTWSHTVSASFYRHRFFPRVPAATGGALLGLDVTELGPQMTLFFKPYVADSGTRASPNQALEQYMAWQLLFKSWSCSPCQFRVINRTVPPPINVAIYQQDLSNSYVYLVLVLVCVGWP